MGWRILAEAIHRRIPATFRPLENGYRNDRLVMQLRQRYDPRVDFSEGRCALGLCPNMPLSDFETSVSQKPYDFPS